MAKQVNKPITDLSIGQQIDRLKAAIKITTEQVSEQTKINKEILRAIALLETGLATNSKDAEKLITAVTRGGDLVKASAKEWLEKHGATLAQIKSIEEKFKSIDGLIEDVSDSTEKLNTHLEDTSEILEDHFDLTKNILDTHEDINKILDKQKDLFSDSTLSVNSMNKSFEVLLENAPDLGEKLSKAFGSIDVGNDLFETMSKDIQSMMDNVSGNFVDVKLEMNQAELNKQIAQFKDKLSASISVKTGNLSSFLSEITTDYASIVELISKGVDLTDIENKQLDTYLSKLDPATKILIKQAQIRLNDSKTLATSVDQQKKVYDTVHAMSKPLAAAEAITQKIGSGFEWLNSIMPSGIGEFIGLNKVASKLIESHADGVKNFTDALSRGEQPLQAMGKYVGSFKTVFASILSPAALFVGILGGAYALISSTVDKYKTMSKEMGTSLGQSQKLYYSQLNSQTASTNQFATLQDIQDIQKEMIGSQGDISKAMGAGNEQLAITLSEMGKVFGYGNEQAAKLHKTFTSLGADDKLSETLQRNMGYIAETVGLSPGIISQDLLDSAEEISTYFGGMPEDAARAVISVRQMGMSLKQAGSIAKKMIGDMGGFMTDMYELQAMTGGKIDFSEAFDKGLQGDIEGMTKSMMDNIGSLKDFQDMDYLTRTKLANTMGMSVDELTKSVQLRDTMLGMSKEEQALAQKNLANISAADMLSKDALKSKLSELQSTDKLAVAWEKIKMSLVKAVLPAVEMFAAFLSNLPTGAIEMIAYSVAAIAAGFAAWTIGGGLISGLGKATGFVKSLTGGVGIFGNLLDKAKGKISDLFNGTKTGTIIDKLTGGASAVGETKSIFEKIFDGIQQVTGKILDFVGGVVEKIAEVAGNSIKSILTGIGEGLNVFNKNAIFGAAALVLVSGALYIAAKAFQEFNTVQWPALLEGIAAMGALAAMAVVLSKIEGDIIMGALAIGLLGAALIPFGYAVSLMKNAPILEAAAGIALLAATAGIIGSPPIIGFIGLGALAIAGLGVAVLVFAKALEYSKDGFKVFNETIHQMAAVDGGNLIKIGLGLWSIASGMGALMAIQIGSKVMDFFTGDVISSKLEKLSTFADPITILATSINILVSGLAALSSTLDGLKVDSLEKLSDVGDISSKFNASMNVGASYSTPSAVSRGPSAKSVAQNVSVGGAFNPSGQDSGNNVNTSSVSNNYSNSNSNNYQTSQLGNGNGRIESLLQQLITAVNGISNRPNEIVIGNQQISQLNLAIKSRNNNS